MDKLTLHKHCLAVLDDRMIQYRASQKDIDEALAGDSKSSAGDKYETSREMLRQEYDKMDLLIVNAQRDKSRLENVSLDQRSMKVIIGSLIHTSIGWLYIAAPLGKIVVSGRTVFVISSDSPMAQAMHGKSVGDEEVVNNRKIRLLEIL